MTAHQAVDRPGDGLHPSQIIALVLGAAYALVGVVGFAVTGFDDFAAGDTGDKLLFFELNPLHNVVHLILGIAGLAMFRTVLGARYYGWALAVGYAAVFVYGLLVAGEADGNILSLNAADNLLHLGTVVISLAGALWPSTETATR